MTGACCHGAVRNARRSASWLAPAAVLLLMPKCPMCVAAYVAAATGLSISAGTAGWLRLGLIAGSTAVLLYLVWRTFHRHRRRPASLSATHA
ncbi:MAG TPA: hypothetical protein VEA69_16180 [Tepidisphaeraceae bacterium]|nr:hypothetical protein [Tepidisphaeraceae bacterium]